MPNFNNRSCSWLSLFVVAGLITSCLILSNWQIHRFQEKQFWVNIRSKNNNQPPLKQLPKALTEELEGQKFAVNGRIDFKRVFLRDNTYFKHKAGYLVYAPVQSKNTWYLANLGWLEKNNKLTKKPFNPIVGSVYCPKGKEFYLKKIKSPKGWPKVIQTLDLSEVNSMLGHNIGRCLLMVKTDLKTIENKKPLSPERHLGYAFQWLLFACIMLYIFLRVTRSQNETP